MTLERLAAEHTRIALPRPVGVVATFLAVTVGWVIFRASDFTTAFHLLAAMVHPGAVTPDGVIITADSTITLAVALALCFLPAIPAVSRWRAAIAGSLAGRSLAAIAASLLLSVALAKAVTIAFHPFLYFRF